MPLRPEISVSEVLEFKLNRECTATSRHGLRRQRPGTLFFQSFVAAIVCLLIFGIPTESLGQDVKPPAIEVETTGAASTGPDSSETSLSEATSTIENSQKDDPQPKTVAEAASSRTPLREINLLEKGLTETWSYFSSDGEAQLADAWVLKSVDEQLQLVCRGTPKGFLYTKAQHSNFRLTFEWKYITDPDSNSGVLIYTQKEPRLWPTAMQVQLHQPLAGCIFPGGDATSDNSTEAQGLARKVGEWNSCLIVSEGGKLSVEINGRKAGEVSGCQPSTGFIALQAEGSETHFRKLMLQVLPPPEAKPAVTAKAPVKPAESGQKPEAPKSTSDDEPKPKPSTFDG